MIAIDLHSRVPVYEQIEALIAQFEGATLRFSTFPTIVDNISAATSSAYPNNAVSGAPTRAPRKRPAVLYVRTFI